MWPGRLDQGSRPVPADPAQRRCHILASVDTFTCPANDAARLSAKTVIRSAPPKPTGFAECAAADPRIRSAAGALDPDTLGAILSAGTPRHRWREGLFGTSNGLADVSSGVRRGRRSNLPAASISTRRKTGTGRSPGAPGTEPDRVSHVLARFGKQALELSLWHAIQPIGALFQSSAIKNGYAATRR